MAANILASLFSTAAFKISRGVSEKGIATNLKVIKITVKLSSAAMRHANEDGTTTTDVRIIKPTSIAIDAYCPDLDTISQVNSIIMDREAQYSISTRGVSFNNLLAINENARQTPEVLTATPIRLSFKSVPSDMKPPVILGQAADSSIVNRGMLLVNQAKQNVTDLSAKVKTGVDKIKGML